MNINITVNDLFARVGRLTMHNDFLQQELHKAHQELDALKAAGASADEVVPQEIAQLTTRRPRRAVPESPEASG